MNATEFFGAGGGSPVGTIASGNITDPDWLPMNNGIYLKSDYPLLDTSKMLTFDGQSVVTGPTITARNYKLFNCGGSVWYAYSTTDTVCQRSIDNGATWTPGTLPVSPSAGWGVSLANGLFFFLKNSNAGGNTQTYYTSPDGLTWTSRTLPGIWAAQSSIGVAYINNLYVALPGQNNGTPVASYSSDGITWTNSAGWGSSNVQISGFSSTFAVAGQSRRSGLCVVIDYIGGTYSPTSMWTTDGVNWVAKYHYPNYGSASSLTPGPSVAFSAEDAFGNLVTSNYVWSSQSTYSPRISNRSVLGLPLAKTNIHSNGSAISEDHGATPHRVSTFNIQMDAFNGGRLMSINSGTGVVSWLDVSPTKFRAVPLPMDSSEIATYLTYIKAR